MAIDYLKRPLPDTAQASEKLNMAARKALRDYIEKCESDFKVQIVPDIPESWSYGIYHRLARLIAKRLGNETLKQEFLSGWDAAFAWV